MKRALIFGAGLSGQGAEELLKKEGYTVYLVDDRSGITSEEGMEILDRQGLEFIVKSPGIPWTAELLLKAKKKDIKIISEIDLAYSYMDKKTKLCKGKSGISGKSSFFTYRVKKFIHFCTCSCFSVCSCKGY